jgi:hypothetical protein
MPKNSPSSAGNNFDKEANAAARHAAQPGKQKWYDFRSDLPNYPRTSSGGAAVVDAIVESFCRRDLSFTVADVESCRADVPEEFVRGSVERQLWDLVRDEYIRKSGKRYERWPLQSLDKFSGKKNGGHGERTLVLSQERTLHQRSTRESKSQNNAEQTNAAATRLAIAELEEQLIVDGAFDPTSVKDSRTRTLTAIVRRSGQPAFRQALITAYNGRCAITECDVVDVLEAAHITPYKGEDTNCVGNGLLLRADVHTLFDLRLIAIDESTMQVLVSTELDGTYFDAFRGKEIIIPDDPDLRPIQAALKHHREECGLRG